MDKTRALALFLGVARAGSFSRAAADQGLTPQAMSKAVGQLEKQLGVRLLHRTTRKLSLTDEGARLVELAGPGLQLLDEALDDLQHSRQHMDGLIRIAAPVSLGSCLLVPLMKAFRDKYPDVRFDAQLDDRFTDLVEAKIDLGIRAGTAPDRNVIARHVGDIELLICASPEYLKKYGVPQSLDELAAHRCTGFRHPNTGRTLPWELTIDDKVVLQEVPAVVTFNGIETEVEAVRAGIGIGQLTRYAIEADLARGSLVALLPQYNSARLKLYLYYPQRRTLPLRVRRFIDFAMDFMRTQVRGGRRA
jgi:DNA-binding transcriptional LysR family regulator